MDELWKGIPDQSVIWKNPEKSKENEYHIITHVCGIQKNSTDKSIFKEGKNRDADIENGPVGRLGEGGAMS